MTDGKLIKTIDFWESTLELYNLKEEDPKEIKNLLRKKGK